MKTTILILTLFAMLAVKVSAQAPSPGVQRLLTEHPELGAVWTNSAKDRENITRLATVFPINYVAAVSNKLVRPATISGFPPVLPAAPVRLKVPVRKALTERRLSVGFVKKVPFPVLPRIRPQSLSLSTNGNTLTVAVPVEVAFHGAPYVMVFYAPYRIQFLYSDYYLEAGRTYQFEEKNSVTGAWERTADPYTPAGDEVYAKAPAAFEVNGAYSTFGESQMRVVP